MREKIYFSIFLLGIFLLGLGMGHWKVVAFYITLNGVISNEITSANYKRLLFLKEPSLLVDYPSYLKQIALPGSEERWGEGEEGKLVSLFCLLFFASFPTQNH